MEKEIELLANISYLIKESGMSYFEVMNLPYAIFLGLLKHFRMFALMQTEEGQKMLQQEKLLSQTEPDWGRLRNQEFYKKEVMD